MAAALCQQDLVQDKKIDSEAGRQIIEIERLQRERRIPRSEAEEYFQEQREVLATLDVVDEKSKREQAWRAIISHDRAIDRERRIHDREKLSQGNISREQAENEINSQDSRDRLAKKILKSYFDERNVKMQLGDWIRGEPGDRPYIPDSVRATFSFNIEQHLENERQRREKFIIEYGQEFISIESQWRKRVDEILRDIEPETPPRTHLSEGTRDRTYSGSPAAYSRSDTADRRAHQRPASKRVEDRLRGDFAR